MRSLAPPKSLPSSLYLPFSGAPLLERIVNHLIKEPAAGMVYKEAYATINSSGCNRPRECEIYRRELVDLRRETWWEFLNTLFSVSEAVVYIQTVDRLDDGTI